MELELRDPGGEQREPGRKGGLGRGRQGPPSPERSADGSADRRKELVGANMLCRL